MLITKRSRRRSELFESRFRDGSGSDFPVRQYLRGREDMVSGLVHAFLLGAFLVTLMAFGRTLHGLFVRHGADLNPWYERGSFGLLALFCLSVLRRLYYKVSELWALRREMAALKASFRIGAPDDPD